MSQMCFLFSLDHIWPLGKRILFFLVVREELILLTLGYAQLSWGPQVPFVELSGQSPTSRLAERLQVGRASLVLL